MYTTNHCCDRKDSFNLSEAYFICKPISTEELIVAYTIHKNISKFFNMSHWFNTAVSVSLLISSVQNFFLKVSKGGIF